MVASQWEARLEIRNPKQTRTTDNERSSRPKYAAGPNALGFVELTQKNMLRITPTDGSKDQVVLRLEGRVAGPWVTELWKACEKALGEGQALVLDLAGVSFLDSAGVTLLRKFRSNGVELAECSPFVTEQLKATG